MNRWEVKKKMIGKIEIKPSSYLMWLFIPAIIFEFVWTLNRGPLIIEGGQNILFYFMDIPIITIWVVGFFLFCEPSWKKELLERGILGKHPRDIWIKGGTSLDRIIFYHALCARQMQVVNGKLVCPDCKEFITLDFNLWEIIDWVASRSTPVAGYDPTGVHWNPEIVVLRHPGELTTNDRRMKPNWVGIRRAGANRAK